MRDNPYRWPTSKWAAIALLALAGAIFSVSALADVYSDLEGVPRLVPFRGHIEQDGAAVDSDIEATFSLYDAMIGGARIWGPEVHQVTPKHGDFVVMLGETEPLAPGLLLTGEVYVEVQVEGDVLQGRQRLGAAPYSLRAANGVPTGCIISFAAETPPAGWLLCDGRALNSENPAHHELFQVLGTLYGNGAGGAGSSAATNFNVPDLRGQFLRGAHGGLDPDGDRGVGSEQTDAFASHSHPLNDPGHSHTVHSSPVGDCACNGREGGLYEMRYGANFGIAASTTGVTIQAAGGIETRPVNVAVNFIIKL